MNTNFNKLNWKDFIILTVLISGVTLYMGINWYISYKMKHDGLMALRDNYANKFIPSTFTGKVIGLENAMNNGTQDPAIMITINNVIGDTNKFMYIRIENYSKNLLDVTIGDTVLKTKNVDFLLVRNYSRNFLDTVRFSIAYEQGGNWLDF